MFALIFALSALRVGPLQLPTGDGVLLDRSDLAQDTVIVATADHIFLNGEILTELEQGKVSTEHLGRGGVGVPDKVTDLGRHVQVAGASALGQSEHVADTAENEQLSVGTRTLPKRIVGRHEAIPTVDVLVMHD